MTPTTAPRRRAVPRRKTSDSCTTCGDGLPAYFAVLTPPLKLCALCRLLPLSRPPDAAGVPEGEETALCATIVSEAREAPQLPLPAEHAKKERALALVLAWVIAHDNRLPTIRDFGHGKALPPLGTIYRLWGGVIPLRNSLVLMHPNSCETMDPWTPHSICAAFRAWIVRHPYAIPLVKDLQFDSTLPGLYNIHHHFHGLRRFYQIFESGQYAARFDKHLGMLRRLAGQRSQEAQRGRRAAP